MTAPETYGIIGPSPVNWLSQLVGSAAPRCLQHRRAALAFGLFDYLYYSSTLSLCQAFPVRSSLLPGCNILIHCLSRGQPLHSNLLRFKSASTCDLPQIGIRQSAVLGCLFQRNQFRCFEILGHRVPCILLQSPTDYTTALRQREACRPHPPPNPLSLPTSGEGGVPAGRGWERARRPPVPPVVIRLGRQRYSVGKELYPFPFLVSVSHCNGLITKIVV